MAESIEPHSEQSHLNGNILSDNNNNNANDNFKTNSLLNSNEELSNSNTLNSNNNNNNTTSTTTTTTSTTHIDKSSNYDENSRSNEVNPFINNILNELTFLQKLQIIVMSFTIAPIRVFFIVFFLLLLWPIGIIINFGRTKKDKLVPMSGWRKSLYPIARFLSRGVFFSIGFHSIKTVGIPDMTVPIMVIAPHSSFFDVLLIVYLNFVCVIGRSGADEILLFGNLTKLCQPIIVDREKYQSRSDSVRQLHERVKSEHTWPPLSIFCEGTCTNRKALVQFKPGAFIPGLPVQPVCIKYSDKLMDTYSWSWEGPHPYTLCWLSVCQIYSPIEFHFLPVYNPSEEEKANAELYAENIQKLMGNYLNIPVSDLSFEDGRLMTKVHQYGLPFSMGSVKVQKLKKKFGINIEEILELVPVYSKLANHPSGLCYLDRFAQNLGFKLTQPVIRLFELFDKKGSGNITLARFIEAYLEYINIKINKTNLSEHVENFIQSLDKFKNSENQELKYTPEEFQNELKLKNNVEFVHFNQFKLDNDHNISKETIRKNLTNNILILYLLTIISKE